MTQIETRKTRYVSARFTANQHGKLLSLATLKGSSVNGVLCDLVDSIRIEFVMSQNAKNDVGVRQDTANVVL